MDAPSPDLREEDVVFELVEIGSADDPGLAQARADIEAGRYITNDQVMEWVDSWGTANELSRPTWRK